MAKTIKEMAEETYPFRWSSGRPTLADKERIEGFIDGANAMLEEIEKLLPTNEKNLNDYGIALVWRIKEKIKELKGEEL